MPDVFYRFYHRSEKNACPDLNGLCPRIIIERLNWWLEHNNIITTWQAGFRSSYTTEDQLNILTQEIQNGLQMNKDMIAVFVDQEKSYDKCGRQGLFIKMRDVGIQQHVPMDEEPSHGQNNSHPNRVT